jgi:hypothetical protein
MLIRPRDGVREKGGRRRSGVLPGPDLRKSPQTLVPSNNRAVEPLSGDDLQYPIEFRIAAMPA